MTTSRYTTDADIRDDVLIAIQAGAGSEGINVDDIVREIIERVGIEGYATLPADEFWQIVARHDSTQF